MPLNSQEDANTVRRSELLAHPLLRWAPAVAVAVITGLIALHRPDALRLTDLQVYMGAVETLRNGGELYDYIRNGNAPFTYPPFAALLMLPLSLLPTWLLHTVWTAGTGLAAIALAVLFNRRAAPWIALALMLSAPVSSTFKYGQVSLLLAVLVTTDVLALRHSRHQGVLIGLAAAVKLTPLIFIPMLWLTGRRRAAALATSTFLATTALAAYLLPHESWRYWTAEFHDVARLGFITSVGNQSLNGALLRLETPHRELLATLLAGAIAALALAQTAKRPTWRRPAAQRPVSPQPTSLRPTSLRPTSLRPTSPRPTSDPTAPRWPGPASPDPRVALVITGAAGVVLSPVSWTHHQVWLVLAAFLPLAPAIRASILAIMLLPVTALAWWPLQESRLLLAITLALLLPTLLATHVRRPQATHPRRAQEADPRPQEADPSRPQATGPRRPQATSPSGALTTSSPEPRTGARRPT